MGHSDINTTKQYLDTEKEDMMALANKLFFTKLLVRRSDTILAFC